MCGIAGQIALNRQPIRAIKKHLNCMSDLIKHRGPDGEGYWIEEGNSVGLAHRRLSVIDLSENASQPMVTESGNVITYNGEIYNFLELKHRLQSGWGFKTKSDTECILAAYEKFGLNCLNHFRGMFAFAIWDSKNMRLFCARDRFGIKPFYYCQIGSIFYFASEAKALVPFLKEICTNKNALSEYLTFQYTIGEKTLFSGINQLLPGQALVVENGQVKTFRYWDVNYEIDFNSTTSFFHNRLSELIDDSVEIHGRSDVPVGSYVSGGIDSSLIFKLARKNQSSSPFGFHGRFTEFDGYDESRYAEAAVKHGNGLLSKIDISSNDFVNNFENVIYHLDFPVAGPGSFPQYMVSKLASEKVKVVLGGQGGDEIFGGYARYLLAYLEQSLKAAIDGNYKNGNYVVTIESIIPNLGILREYKPLIKQFWKEGLFDSMDRRYFRLINRSSDMRDEINWSELEMDQVFNDFSTIFNNPKNVEKEAYFDKMTHFDFKCLLPALLQVEDRMSMAHGIETRVPFLDHPLVEFSATIPADKKFKGGNMKHLLKQVFSSDIPQTILERRDKMGFPVPLKEWMNGSLKDFSFDILKSTSSRHRPFINSEHILKSFDDQVRFSRKTWALMALEVWHQQFHDKSEYWKSKLDC